MRAVRIAAGLVHALVLLGSAESVSADASCLDSLAAHRAQTEADYLTSKDAPFDAAMRARFAGFSFRFQLGGATQALTAYQRMDLPAAERNWVLIPFQDRTNGKQAYGGGRYLDLYFPISAHTELGFNPVTAGEQAYAGKHSRA